MVVLGDALARRDVVGDEITDRDLAGTTHGDPRWASGAEGAGCEDGVADDHLAPDHAVDLPGRQDVDRDGRRSDGVVTSCGAVSAAADPAGMTVRPTATTAVEAADTTHLVIREMPT